VSCAFGVDPQHTRTVIVLAEGPHVRSVGDGRRHLVPNACGPDGLWGSPAAEQRLQALDDAVDAADLADHVLDWRCDPLDTPFLSGLRPRIDSYLGRTGRTPRDDTVCLVVADDQDVPAGRWAEAGLPAVTTVAPTDALVCRWLSVPRAAGPFEGRVVAVACGETRTDVAAYEVTHDAGVVRITLAAGGGRIRAGFGVLSTELADRVLQRATEGITAAALLTVLDGTWEYGAELTDAGLDDEVVWDKSLAGRMFHPLRLSHRQVAGWPVAAAARSAVASLAKSVAGRRPLLLVGGIGATWPVAADAVDDLGEVWRSTMPAHDLAVGAAHWPQLRQLFAGPVPRPRREQAATAVPAAPTPAGEHDGEYGEHHGLLDHLPPWKRDT